MPDKESLNTQWNIKQIMPAQPGWKAVHCVESENGQVVILNRTIVCWALVEGVGVRESQTQVRGMEEGECDLKVVDDSIAAKTIRGNGLACNQYFIGYNDPNAHHESDYWIAQANRRLKKEKELLSSAEVARF